MGIVGSVLVGWLIDKIGLEICTALTLMLGQLQMVLLLLFGKRHSMLLTSYWVYTVFRQFLYPVFIASLTSNLGFKYFGVLLGIGFAVGGCVQLLMTTLVEWAQGSCHLSESNDEDCNHGHWELLHVMQVIILGALLIVPVQDYRAKVLQDSNTKQILRKQPMSYSYGTDL